MSLLLREVWAKGLIWSDKILLSSAHLEPGTNWNNSSVSLNWIKELLQYIIRYILIDIRCIFFGLYECKWYWNTRETFHKKSIKNSELPHLKAPPFEKDVNENGIAW